MLKRPHVAVSPDQSLFARDLGFRGIAFWRLDRDEGEAPFLTAELTRSTVSGLGFSPSGHLVVVTRSGQVRVWGVDTSGNSEETTEPQLIHDLQLPMRTVVATAFSADRLLLAVGDEAGQLTLVNLGGDGPSVAGRQGHTDQVVALAFSGDGQVLSSSGRDRAVRVWSTDFQSVSDDSDAPQDSFEQLHELRGMEGWGIALSFDRRGKRLAVGSMDNGIYLFGLDEDSDLSSVRYVHLGWVSDVEWSPDDSHIMTASWDTTVGMFEADGLVPQLAFELHRDYVVDITFVPGTPFAVSASYDRTAVVWNWETREAVAQLTGHSDWVHFALPLSQNRVATICSDGTNRIWSTEDWSEIRALGTSLSAGFEIGSGAGLSDYFSDSAEPKGVPALAPDPSAKPVTRIRDMRAQASSVGSGQTAMALLRSALDDAPGVEALLPRVMEPDATLATTLTSGRDTQQKVAADEVDAAAEFQQRDVSSAAMEASPEIDVADPVVELPDVTVESSLEDVLDAAPQVAPAAIAASPAQLSDSAIDLPDIEISADPGSLVPEKKDADEDEPSTLEMSPSMLDDLDDLGSSDSSTMRGSVDPFEDHAVEQDRSPTIDGVPSPDSDDGMPQVDDAWADIENGVLAFEEGAIDPIEPSIDMTGLYSNFDEPPAEEPAADEPAAEEPAAEEPAAEEPAAEEPAAEEPAAEEPAAPNEQTDQSSGVHSAAEVETAEVPRELGDENSQSPGRPGSFSTVPGRPPVDSPDIDGPSPALSSAPAAQSDVQVDPFEPRFKNASESESEPDETGIGGGRDTVGYHEKEGFLAEESSRATQQLHNIQPPEEQARQRSKTAVGANLSEESTFDFFFGPQSEVGRRAIEADEHDEHDEHDEQHVDEATSRLVPDQHFTGDFGKSPEVFETNVSEIWAARPEKSDAKMGIVKKPRTNERLFRSAFAIRTYHQWVYSVAIAPDGQSIASCGGNNLVCVWSKNGDLLHQLRAPSSGFNEVKFTPDGLVVVAAGDDGRIHLWMLPPEEYGRIRHSVIEGHESVVSSIAFTPDGRFMLSGSFDGSARVWDMTDGRCRIVLEDHDGPISDVAIAGRRAYTVGHDGTVRIWDDRKWMAVDVFDGFDKLLAVASNGVAHAWTAANGDVYVAEDGYPQGLLQHRGEARGVCVTEAGMVVTAGQDSQIRIYHRGETDPAQSLLAPASLWSLDVHDGVLAAGGDDGRIHIFRS